MLSVSVDLQPASRPLVNSVSFSVSSDFSRQMEGIATLLWCSWASCAWSKGSKQFINYIIHRAVFTIKPTINKNVGSSLWKNFNKKYFFLSSPATPTHNLGKERGVSFLRGLFKWYWYWSKKCDKTRKYKKRVENSIRRRKRREKKKLARYAFDGILFRRGIVYKLIINK